DVAISRSQEYWISKMNGQPTSGANYKDEDVFKLASQLATLNVTYAHSSQLGGHGPPDALQSQFPIGSFDNSSGYTSSYQDVTSSSGAISKSASGSSAASLRLGSSYGDYQADVVQWSDVRLPRNSNESRNQNANFSSEVFGSSYSYQEDSDSPPLDDRTSFPPQTALFDPSHFQREYQSVNHASKEYLFENNFDNGPIYSKNYQKECQKKKENGMSSLLYGKEEPLSPENTSKQGNFQHSMHSAYPGMLTSTPCKNTQESWQYRDDDLNFESDEMQNKCYALASMIAQRQTSLISTRNCEPLNASFSKVWVCGPGIHSAVRGKTASFQVMFDGKDEPAINALNVTLIDPNNHPCIPKIRQISKMAYSIRYKPDFTGAYKVSVTFNGDHVTGSPCLVQVEAQHKYQADTFVKATILGDQLKSITFSKPWGVCCNSMGYIFVGDRGNHTIRVFKPTFMYSHSIGTHGTLPGELNKPAGITCNVHDHIIVADKDNHRIQVFDFLGQVLLNFGEQGHGGEQLNYPWDVATAPDEAILVTDGRNGRVAIFSKDGAFLRDIGSDDQILRNPRGICYRNQDGKLIMTDMTKDQIVVLDLENEDHMDHNPAQASHPMLIGRKGSSPSELNRPQGVTCDLEGNVIVCDSRNNRVQIFDVDANYVNHWQIDSPDPARRAQPMGVAASPAGHILVVDAEYNRILVY
ncbi:Filamin/ABP280 repeat-like, partial [Trinorchestia longiramus]